MRQKIFSRRPILLGILIAIGILLIVSVGIYIGIANSYRDKFLLGTTINGMDVGGLTADEVKTHLASIAEDYTLHIQLKGVNDTEELSLNAKDFSLHYASGDDINKLLSNQNIWAWPKAYFGKQWKRSAGLETEYTEDNLKKAVFQLFEKREEVEPKNADYILDDENIFRILPEEEGNTLQKETAYSAVSEAVAKRKKKLDLTKETWYEHPTVYATDETLVQEVATLNAFLDKTVSILLPNGEKLELQEDKFLPCITKEENGKYQIQDEKAIEIAKQEAETVSSMLDGTVTQRPFTSTMRGTVWFPLSEPAGILVDKEKTANDIATAILGMEDKTIEPSYSLWSDASDFANGGTYVEVDKTNQTVFVYVNGEQKMSSPCVTGLASDPVMDTPEGVFFIIDRWRDIHLRGFDENGNVTYDAPVQYWMQFTYESDGFHDASWRSHFGGTDYLTNGSHGCVNLPLWAAKTLYELAYVGMPVYVFS